MNKLEILRDEPVYEGIIRNFYGQIDIALYFLSFIRSDPDETVHEIRKNMKRVRAIIKLLQYSLGRTGYVQENYYYRDIGRMLSPFRDKKVISDLAEKYSNKRFRGANMEALQSIAERYSQAHCRQINKLTGDHLIVEKVSILLEKGKKRFSQLLSAGIDINLIIDSYTKTYRQTCEVLIKVLQENEPHIKHELRKKAKYFWYQSQLLHNYYPAYFGLLNRQLEKVSDLLGAGHDLFSFQESLRKNGIKKETGDFYLNNLLVDINKYMAKHNISAIELVNKITVEDPGIFKSRIKQYLL